MDLKKENRFRFLYFPKRYIVGLLTSIGLLLLTAIQTNFSLTNSLIVDKNNRSKLFEKENLSNRSQLFNVHWSSIDVSYLNSIFYIGYLLSNLFSSLLVQRFSATKLFVCPLTVVFLMNSFIPWSIRFRSSWTDVQLNYYFIATIRLIQGLSAGWAFPSSHGILSNWCPLSERGRIGSFIYTGLYAGPILGYSLGGFLIDSIGHDSIYYVSALIGLSWSIFYSILIYEYPKDHPRISKEELFYIEQSSTNLKSFNENKSIDEIPWKSILSSMPVWSICLAHFARGWTFYFLLTNQPSLLSSFGFRMKQIGFYGSFPYIFKVFVGLSSGFIADTLRLKYSWSITNIRKLMTCSGYFIQATSILIISYLTNQLLIIVLLTIGVGFSGLMVSGWHLNHQDLSTRYSSVLAGFTSIFGTTAAIFSPIVAGFLSVEENGWHYILMNISFILYSSSIFYYLFCSGDLQPWSNGQSVKEKVRLNSDRFPWLLSSVEDLIQNRYNPSKSRSYSSISKN